MSSTDRTRMRSRTPYLTTAVATLLSALVFCAPSVAAEEPLACEQAPATPAFERFGDSADYTVAPGGTFEEDAPGWTLLGWAHTVRGNENAGITGGGRSLRIGPGGVAVSPEFCVDPANPHFRYMLKPIVSVGSLRTLLHVRSSLTGPLGMLQFSTLNLRYLPLLWRPSSRNFLGNVIPSVALGGKAVAVRLVFTADDGIYDIDSVMVDPYRRR